MNSEKVTFLNKENIQLSARLELPVDNKPHAFAVFAHCFTCNKNLMAVKNISRALTREGIAVLRFDFTGLGESDGDFSESNFSSNVQDLCAAADFLNEHYQAPELLIGHSLGGAAVLSAAHFIASVKGVVTIGAPSAPQHVKHLLKQGLEEIQTTGEAEINIGGRPFQIKKQFLDDLADQEGKYKIKELRRALLVMHSPQDTIVGIQNAAEIYTEAHHPKSFISLDGADHLLSNKADSLYTGKVIANWASRYLQQAEEISISTQHQVAARLSGDDGFTTEMQSGVHSFLADEPADVGGNNLGLSPYDLLASALAACSSMTMQMYARRKEWPVEEVLTHVTHTKEEDVDDNGKKIMCDVFVKKIDIKASQLSSSEIERVRAIAGKCPVHKTLEASSEIRS